METQVCPLCESTRHHHLFHEREHDLVACDDCQLLYISPYPTNTQDVHETVADYDYEDLQILSATQHYESSTNHYARLFPQIREHFASANSALDIGCGTGRLLEILKEEFPQLQRTGIELNIKRAEFAREVADCEILQTAIEHLEAVEPYDVVTMMDVFSHVHDLHGFFHSVRRQLNPYHGKLIMRVGEFTSNVKKSAVRDWDIPDHLHFLGLRTVERLAEDFEFDIVVHDRIPLADDIFSKSAWKSPGRSKVRNVIKKAVASTPFALSAVSTAYKMLVGNPGYSSMIVFQVK